MIWLPDAGSSDFKKQIIRSNLFTKWMIWITRFTMLDHLTSEKGWSGSCILWIGGTALQLWITSFVKPDHQASQSNPLVREGEHILTNSKGGWKRKNIMYLALHCWRLSKVSLLPPLCQGKTWGSINSQRKKWREYNHSKKKNGGGDICGFIFSTFLSILLVPSPKSEYTPWIVNIQ